MWERSLNSRRRRRRGIRWERSPKLGKKFSAVFAELEWQKGAV